MCGQRRGRLIHDEDTDVQGNRLGDLDRLLGGQRKAAGRFSYVERHAQFGENLLGFAKHVSPADHDAAVLVADEDVLGDIEVRKQQRFLIDGSDAEPLRLGGAAYRDWLAAQKDLPAIRLMHAGYDLDERGLTRAVLAKQGMNLAGVERKRHILERLRGVKTLGHSADFQDRRDDRRSVPMPRPLVHPANARRSRR